MQGSVGGFPFQLFSSLHTTSFNNFKWSKCDEIKKGIGHKSRSIRKALSPSISYVAKSPFPRDNSRGLFARKVLSYETHWKCSTCIAIPYSIRRFGYVGNSSFWIALCPLMVWLGSDLSLTQLSMPDFCQKYCLTSDGILESNKPKKKSDNSLGFLGRFAFYELWKNLQAVLPTGDWSHKGRIESPRSRESIVLVTQTNERLNATQTLQTGHLGK